MLDAAFDRLPGRHLLQTDQADAVVDADAVVIRPVLEGQRQEALLFQVGFVDPREAAGDYRRAAQEARRQGGVLAAAALAVIVVADRHPPDAVRLVVAGELADRLALLAGQDVDAGAWLIGKG